MSKSKSSDTRGSGRPAAGSLGGFTAGVQHQSFLGAVIDIGATGVRLAIGEVDGFGHLRLLDSLAMPVSLGVDTFVLGRIERKTMNAAVRALKVYRQKIAEYKIDLAAHVRVVATSAVREARNRLEFIDHVYNLTGLAVEPFDEADVHRVTYLEVLRIFEQHEGLGRGITCVVEIGGGSTEILLLEERDVIFANTFRLGSLRMRRTLDAYRTPGDRVREIMESEVARVGDRLSGPWPAASRIGCWSWVATCVWQPSWCNRSNNPMGWGWWSSSRCDNYSNRFGRHRWINWCPVIG